MVNVESNYEQELSRRHKATSTTVNALMLVTIVVVAVAWFTRNSIYRPSDIWAIGSLPIAIVFLAIGAMMFRRSRFQAMRLQDIAALNGISALLGTLQNTTITVAFVALAIVLLGIIGMILTGGYSEVLRACAVAMVLLVYSYPKKSTWLRVVHGIATDGDANDRESWRDKK